MKRFLQKMLSVAAMAMVLISCDDDDIPAPEANPGQLAVTTVNHRVVTLTSVDLYGSFTVTGNQTIDYAGFAYREMGHSTWTNLTNGVEIDGTTFSCLINNLKEDTQYEYHAFAKLVNTGAAVTASTRTFTTGAVSVTAEELDLISDVKVKMTATYSFVGDETLEEAGFYYKKVDDSNWTKILSAQADITEDAFTVTSENFVGGTAYEYYAFVKLIDRDEHLSETIQFETLPKFIVGKEYTVSSNLVYRAYIAGTIARYVPIVDAVIEIPYVNALGTETYKLSATSNRAGITVETISGTYNTGNDTLRMKISGIPQTSDNITFTIVVEEGVAPYLELVVPAYTPVYLERNRTTFKFTGFPLAWPTGDTVAVNFLDSPADEWVDVVLNTDGTGYLGLPDYSKRRVLASLKTTKRPNSSAIDSVYTNIFGRREGREIALKFNGNDIGLFEADIYEYANINTAVELRNVATLQGIPMQNYYQTDTLYLDSKDADSPWIPIGNASAPYTGIYDGNSHEIYGLTVDNATTGISGAGLFGYTDGATLKNIKIMSGEVKGYHYAGALVGSAFNTTINNVSSAINVTADYDHVGGIAGLFNGSAENVTNTGVVTGKDYVGGIFGDYSGISNKITNSGAVNGQNYVGGIAGNYHDGDPNNADTYYINTGAVTATGNNVGGLFGRVMVVYFAKSNNTGDVLGGQYVGGLVGYVVDTTDVEASYNTGNVSGTSDVGGIIGYFESGAHVIGISGISAVYSTGNVSGSVSGGLVGNVAGGAIESDSYWNKAGIANAYGNASLTPLGGVPLAFGDGIAPNTGWPVATDNGWAESIWKDLHLWTGGGANQVYPELIPAP